MLGEHGVHDAALGVQVQVIFDEIRVPAPAGHLKDRFQPVGLGLIGGENAEIFGLHVEAHHIPHVLAQLVHVLAKAVAGGGNVHRIAAEVGEAEVPEDLAAVGMGIGAHAPVAHGSQLLQLRDEPAVFVKELLRVVAAHPGLQQGDVLRVCGVGGEGDAVGQAGALHRKAVQAHGAGPALGGAEDDHGPPGPGGVVLGAGVLLNTADLPHRPVQGGGHGLVHLGRVVPLHKSGLPAAALEVHLQLLVGDPAEDGGAGTLEAVEVEDGQHGAVGNGVDELVALPGGGQRAGLSLAVSHHAGGNQVGVVHHRAEGVGQGVAQLAALVDGAGGLGAHMTGDAAGEGKLAEKALHALLILAHVGIHLAVCPLQIGLGHHGLSAVAGTGQVDHVQIVPGDDPVEMGIDEVLPRRGAPVAHGMPLEVFRLEGLAEQGIVQQVELTHGQIVGRAPIGVHFAQQRLIKGPPL